MFVFRPFPARQIVEALKDCKAFTVFERMDDPLSTTGNHLTREIKAAFCDAMTGQNGQEKIDRVPRIYQRRGRPGQPRRAARRHHRRVREHDGRRAGLLLRRHRPPAGAEARPRTPTCGRRGGFSMRGHSVGGFGSVTTNKVIATIAGNVFGKDVQAYPKYGSEKKGLPTTYYLTIADSHINMHSELEHVDLLCINDPTAILSPLTLDGLVPGGAIFMQSPYAEPAEVWKRIPPQNQQDHPREEGPRLLLRHGARSPARWRREADLQMRMQGIVLLGAFLQADAVRPARAR